MARPKGTPKTGGRDFSSTNQPTFEQRQAGKHKDLQYVRRITKLQLLILLEKHLIISKEEAREVVQDPETSMLELMVASIVHKGIVQGDERRLNFILDRLGIHFDTKNEGIEDFKKRLNDLDEQETINIGKDAIKFLENKGKKND